MASDEQINNQSRFNDLQKDSNDLLADYQAGIRESSEFVSILTTRSSQLVDTLRDAVSEKKKSSQADKDLISSVTKINNLTKDFATPYTDAGKAIRDTNKALDLHSRLQKDVEVIGNKLGEDRLKQAQEYLDAEKQIGSIELSLASQRKAMTSQDQKSADKIIEAQRNKVEAERQYNKFIETSGINTQSFYAKLGQIQRLEQKQEVERRKYQDALRSGNQAAIDEAKEKYKQAQAANELYKDGLSSIEKQALARQEAKKAAREAYSDEFKAGSEAAKKFAQDQAAVDVQRDAIEEKKKELDVDQQIYIEGQKAIEQSEQGVNYLKEESKRVREIIGAQTLWNLSLGAAESILKKIGLDNQVITVGLDEGTKAAKEYAAELVAGRQKARGEAALAKQVEEDAIVALKVAEQELIDIKLNGSASEIKAAEDAYKEKLAISEQAKADAADAESASRRANSLVTKIGDSFKVLGTGISATFKGMASELKALGLAGIVLAAFKKMFKLLGGTVVTKFITDLKDKFMSGISYLKDQFFSLQSYIEDAQAGDQFLQMMSKATADIATNLGVGTQEARELVTQAGKVSSSLGMMPEELAATTAELQKAFGTTQRFSDDTVKTMGQLTNLLGLSNEEASEFVKLSQLSGQEASDTTLTYKTQIQALKERENIAISEKEVMKEIAKSSASLQLTSRAQGKSLAEAAFHAKKLGLSLAQTEAIGSNLLDFESSIANEMEAELLIGRDLNLDKARQFALNKDIAGVAKEVTKQIGSAAEFGEMNVIQQEALAKSIGVSVDELANMLKTQELLAGTGFDDMNQAQAEFKKLLEETGSEEAALAKMKERGASDALQDQLRSVSLQEKRALQDRAIAEAQGRLATATLKVFDAFKDVNRIIKSIKAVIVKEMKPFFDSFGGLVGKGGKAFEKDVLPYAKQLGKFMNGVGLRIVDIVKNSGPDLRNIFQGVLKLFSSIYGVVGGVVERLLGVEKTGTGAGSTFESIANFLSKMVDKIESIDVDALTEKIKGFVAGVKDTFIMVKTKVGEIIDYVKNSAIGKFLTGNIGEVSLAIAPLAIKGFGKGLLEKGSKMNPMFVKQADAGIFGDALDGALGKRNKGLLKGLKGLSKVTGGKKTVVGRALRNVAAMAGKRSSIGAQVMKSAKGALGKVGGKALGAVGSAAKGIGGKALGALGKIGVKGLVKAIPGVGLIATAGMAAVDAFKGFKNAGEIFEKKAGEEATLGEKLSAGAAGALSGLTFGLLDTKKTAKFLKSTGDSIGKGLGKAFDKVKKTGSKAFSFIFKKLSTQIKNIKNLFVGVFSNVWDYIKDTFNRVKELISSTFSNFVDIFKNLFSGDFSGAFDSLKNIFSGVGTFFFDQFKAGFELVKGLLGNVGTYIKDTFSNIFGGVGEKIMGALKSPINGMISLLNGLINNINETLTVDLGPLGSIETSIPNIPMLAKGGIVENPTLAVIGEAGPEAVIPLDKLSSTVESSTETPSQNVDELKQELQEMKQMMASFVEQMGQVVNRPITVELNGNKVGQALGQNSYRIQ